MFVCVQAGPLTPAAHKQQGFLAACFLLKGSLFFFHVWKAHEVPCGEKKHVAMGQKPVPRVNIPIPTK